jgi:hypothetical protein
MVLNEINKINLIRVKITDIYIVDFLEISLS